METFSTPNQAPNTIALLTRRLRAGDEAAFRDFHARYFDRLYHFLLVVSRGNEDEAQEALQQTLLRVVRYIRVFQSEENFWCWLKVVARSAARDAGRKQQRYTALLQKFALRWSNGEAHAASDEQGTLRDCLEESMNELGAEDRLMIERKYIEGEPMKDLAAYSGLTQKAAESRLLRLRRQLRHLILTKLNST